MPETNLSTKNKYPTFTKKQQILTSKRFKHCVLMITNTTFSSYIDLKCVTFIDT